MNKLTHNLRGSVVERKFSIIRGAMRNDWDEVKAALAEDPKCINDQDERLGITALHVAAANGSKALAEFLIQQPGCDPAIFDYANRTPADLAFAIGRTDLSKVIDVASVEFDWGDEIREALGEPPKPKQAETTNVVSLRPRPKLP